MSNLSDLIGVPFEYGGRGPDKFDCYGLVLHLLKQDGIEAHDLKSPNVGKEIVAMVHSELKLWQECAIREGAVLLFRVPGNLHVGYCLHGDKFIHTWEQSGGVTIEKLSIWKKRLVGVYEYIG
jgi:cell wall-associated NlpC family hydrolase